jgi:hypothetical protein
VNAEQRKPPAPTDPSPAHTAFRIVVDLENADDYDDAVYAAEQVQGALRGQGYKNVAVVDTERETAAAVAAQSALPVPVGDQPQPLDDTRLAEITARVEAASRGPWTLAYESCDCSEDCGHGLYVSRLDTGAGPATELLDLPGADWELMAHARTDVPALLAEVERLKTERDAFRGQRKTVFATNEQLLARVEESGQARLRAENEARTTKREADALRTRVAELEAERHTTNEALDDAVQALRESHATPATNRAEEAS